MIVDEWDKFELERDLKKLKEKVEETNMGELNIAITLDKNGNKVTIGATNVSKDDFEDYREFCKLQVVDLANNLPNTKEYTRTVKPDTYVKETEPRRPEEQKTYEGMLTKLDITTEYLKGKQYDIALKGIADGKYTLEQVNALSSWDEMQELLFSK